jgi:CHAD domain-containing protein
MIPFVDRTIRSPNPPFFAAFYRFLPNAAAIPPDCHWPVRTSAFTLPAGLSLEAAPFMPLVKNWESTLQSSLAERWKRYRRALNRCRRKFSEKAVHDSRVEARRLLSLLELLNVFIGRAHLKRSKRVLKRHLDAFDQLRDTQVQILLLEKCQRQFPETKPLLDKLARHEKRCLKQAQRRLEKIRSSQLKKVVHLLCRQLARLHPDAAHRTAVLISVADAFTRTAALQRAMDPGAVETIHETRIAFKRFRYMIEALEPLYPSITPQRLAAMQKYQAMMGEVQDSEVLLARLDKYARRHPARRSTLSRFRHWILQRHTGQISYCLQHADGLHEFWPIETRTRGGVTRAPRRPRPPRRKNQSLLNS